jgi:hypothetical protein
MRNTRKPALVARFDVLEDRVVMSRASIVNADVTAFFGYYAATMPPLTANSQTLNNTAMMTHSPSDIAAANAAKQLVVNSVVGDVNGLARMLYRDLGNSGYNSIRLSVTGISSATPGVYFVSGTPNSGSLMASLLTLAEENTGALAGTQGLQLAADLSITTASAVSVGRPILPTSPFGNFTATYFTDVYPLALQLQMDKQSASTPPTMAQQTAINNDIAAIDAVTIRDTNALATTLVAQLGRNSTAGIGTIITGVNSTTSPIFTPGGAAPGYGSLLATLLTLDQRAGALLNPDVVINIVTQTAFI